MKEITTYLNFDGTCREAMTFYAKCLGAELYVMRFSEVPGDFPPEAKDKIMHAKLSKGTATLLMASDAMNGAPFKRGTDTWISINCESLAEIERLFAAIGEGGTVIMGLQDTFWGARFGMLKDRFGIQ